MSSATEEEEDENNNNNSVGEAISSPTMMSRRLQTFGSPDLAVTVGIDEIQYNYHALILASQSLYVDTLLSSPAARTEQERGRISFPDITVETWEKMMMYLLRTNDVPPSTSDLVEIVPFYDKYQFIDGLAYCDKIIKRWLVSEIIDGTIFFRSLDGEDEKNMAWLTRYIYDLPDFFPKSRSIAIKWGKEECLSKLRWSDEDTVKTLLPLIENDNDTTKALVSTYLGRKFVGMTMNEMRDLVKQPDFPEQCIFRNEQIRLLDEQREQLRVKDLRLRFGGEAVNGDYECRDHYHYESQYCRSATHSCGAMRYVWRKEKNQSLVEDGDNPSVNVKLEALNFYGSAWEVYSCTETDDNEEIEGSKKVLYRWESDIFSSLVPPKIGWEEIDDDGNCVKSKIRLDYSYGKRW